MLGLAVACSTLALVAFSPSPARHEPTVTTPPPMIQTLYPVSDFAPVTPSLLPSARSRLTSLVATPISHELLKVSGRVVASGKVFPLSISINPVGTLPASPAVKAVVNKKTGRFSATVTVPPEYRQAYEDASLSVRVSGTAKRKNGHKDSLSKSVASPTYLGVDPSPLTPTGPGTWAFTPPAEPPLLGSPEAFMYYPALPDGSFRRWNPCKPIPYVVTANGASQQALDLLTGALANISASTGQTFEYKGTSDLIPLAPGVSLPRDLLVLGFATEAQVSYLAGSVAGVAGGATSPADPSRYVSGMAVFDLESYSYQHMAEGPALTQIFLHELGHALGLNHVEDSSQVMYPSNTRDKDRYQAGDRNGLIQLNLRGCMK